MGIIRDHVGYFLEIPFRVRLRDLSLGDPSLEMGADPRVAPHIQGPFGSVAEL